MKLDRLTPVCQPLHTFEQVLAWQPGCDDLCVSKTTRSTRKPFDGPKTLICHDMRGGYLEDRLVQGCPKSDCYHFYHWQYVDTFVYFSHHFVTIPPPTWTVPAHRHGVKVLGTLITEWDDGKKRCDAVLTGEETFKAFADQLVKISNYYGFDGWLVNIENPVEEEGQVMKLREFVKYLTEQQHQRDPTSEVIWYDSIIETGKLDWQNELNEKNRMFFDVCDGIFLNYCWKDENLKASKSLAVEVNRPYDVYIGIDVFGRGCLGDGGFNTCEALAAAHNLDLSAALFANGWVYEKLGKECFVQNENKFWSCLNDYCSPRNITSLPLVTTFCHGQGQKYWSEGKVLNDAWYNQSVQQLQPSFTGAQFDSEEFSPFMPIMECYTEDAFTGGNSLKLSGKLAKGQSVEFKLFSLDIHGIQYFEEPKQEITGLYVSITYKPVQNMDSELCICLDVNKYKESNLVSKVVLILPTSSRDSVPCKKLAGADNTSVVTQIIVPVQLLEVPAQVRSQEPDADTNGWKTIVYKLDENLENARLGTVTAVMISNGPESQITTVLLGELKIIPIECISDNFPEIIFGETVYHDDQPTGHYLEAENNKCDSGVGTEDKQEESTEDVSAQEDSDLTQKTSLPNEESTEDVSAQEDSDLIQKTNLPKEESTEDVSAQENSDLSQKTSLPKEESTEDVSAQEDSDLSQKTSLPSDSDTVKCSDTAKCSKSFTLQWRVSNPALVQYYRLFQIIEPFGNLKLLGMTVLPHFKVTGFELMESIRNTSGTVNSMGDNSMVTRNSSLSEATFRCIVQPVMMTGKPVPLNICNSNIKCEVFRLDS